MITFLMIKCILLFSSSSLSSPFVPSIIQESLFFLFRIKGNCNCNSKITMVPISMHLHSRIFRLDDGDSDEGAIVLADRVVKRRCRECCVVAHCGSEMMLVLAFKYII